MIRHLEQVDDATLDARDAAGCCTGCVCHLVAGKGNQVVDAKGRVHRFCEPCYRELMAAVPDGDPYRTIKHPVPPVGPGDLPEVTS